MIRVSVPFRLIATSAFVGRDDPRLRRAQALAPFTRTGFELARELVSRKIQGQARVLSSRHVEGAAVLTGCMNQLEGAESMTDIRRIEAAAAIDYWQHLASTELPFDRVSTSRIPWQWRTLGQRGSGLGGWSTARHQPRERDLELLLRARGGREPHGVIRDGSRSGSRRASHGSAGSCVYGSRPHGNHQTGGGRVGPSLPEDWHAQVERLP
jgi:hypothetical protein